MDAKGVCGPLFVLREVKSMTNTEKDALLDIIQNCAFSTADAESYYNALDAAFPSAGNTDGLSTAVKNALLAIFQKAAYSTDNGQTYYDALNAAFFPPQYITAVFNQGQSVIYNTDDLDTLRQYLTVTAYYTNKTEVVTNYTLTGSLTVGTSTITASYGGLSDTFNVTVTKMPNGLVDGTYTAKGKTNQVTVSQNAITFLNPQVNYLNYTIPFQHPIQLHAGDVVTFSAKDASAYNNSSVPIGFNGSYINTGGNFCPWKPSNKVVTLSSDMVAESIYLQALNTYADRYFTFVLLVNGEEVF